MTRALVALVGAVVARPRVALLAVLVATVAALAFTVRNFELSSDTTKLVRQDAPFRRDYRDLVHAFPHYDQSIFVVVTAEEAGAADAAADRLAAAMRARPDVLTSVYSMHAPDGEPFFRNHGLLYLDRPDLERVIDRLSEAQPALAALARDPSLRAVADQLELALDEAAGGAALPGSFVRITDRVSRVGEELADGRPEPMRWRDEIVDLGGGPVHRLLSARPRIDDRPGRAGRAAVETIRALAVEEGLTPESGVRVRLTGMVPLATEELDGARDSMGLAAGLSFVALAAIMTFGIRSLRVIVATLSAVIVGTLWTAAFGIAAVGELNVLSMGFSVLLIGMSVDYAIHLCLHYLEVLETGASPAHAALEAVRSVGWPLTLCAITSSIGFFAYLPTDYRGLAELGLMTGAGMFIALLATLVVCPAVLTAFGRPRGRPPKLQVSGTVIGFLGRHAAAVSSLALLLGVLAAALSTRMTFEFSTLAMKDPESESVRALADLTSEGGLSDYALTVLAPDRESVDALAERLEALDVVAEVRRPADYLPAEQDEKLVLLEDAELFLWPVLEGGEPAPPPEPAERVAALERLRAAALGAASSSAASDPDRGAARRLAEAVERVAASPDPERAAAEYERLLVGDLPALLDWLRGALEVEPLGFDDLPAALRARLVSEDGRVVLSIVPAEDLAPVEALRRFVEEVRAVAPEATGRASVEAGIGEIVVRSFHQALAIAAVLIVVVLLATLRSLPDAVLVLVPLALSALGTVAIGDALGLHFNMSNVIAIPLVMGLGVDNGIHVIARFRRERSLEGVLRSSTPRAVLLSGLTTLGAFGALSVSTHLGIRSMGLLLSIALVLLMLTTVLVLPALVTWRDARPGGSS